MVGTGEISDNYDSDGLPIIIGYAGLKPVYMTDDFRQLIKKLKEILGEGNDHS